MHPLETKNFNQRRIIVIQNPKLITKDLFPSNGTKGTHSNLMHSIILLFKATCVMHIEHNSNNYFVFKEVSCIEVRDLIQIKKKAKIFVALILKSYNWLMIN